MIMTDEIIKERVYVDRLNEDNYYFRLKELNNQLVIEVDNEYGSKLLEIKNYEEHRDLFLRFDQPYLNDDVLKKVLLKNKILHSAINKSFVDRYYLQPVCVDFNLFYETFDSNFIGTHFHSSGDGYFKYKFNKYQIQGFREISTDLERFVIGKANDVNFIQRYPPVKGNLLIKSCVLESLENKSHQECVKLILPGSDVPLYLRRKYLVQIYPLSNTTDIRRGYV